MILIPFIYNCAMEGKDKALARFRFLYGLLGQLLLPFEKDNYFIPQEDSKRFEVLLSRAVYYFRLLFYLKQGKLH